MTCVQHDDRPRSWFGADTAAASAVRNSRSSRTFKSPVRVILYKYGENNGVHRQKPKTVVIDITLCYTYQILLWSIITYSFEMETSRFDGVRSLYNTSASIFSKHPDTKCVV